MSYFVAELAGKITLPSKSAGVIVGYGERGLRYGDFMALANLYSWQPEQGLWDACGNPVTMLIHVRFWAPSLLVPVQGVIDEAKGLLQSYVQQGHAIAISTKQGIENQSAVTGICDIPRVIGKIRGDDANKRWERAAELVICDIIRKHIPVHPGLMKGV